MRVSKSLPLLILSWHLLGSAGYAQSVETVAPSPYAFQTESSSFSLTSDSLYGDGAHAALLHAATSFGHDSLHAHSDGERCARAVARVDPDILIYATPPESQMPTIEPPDGIDSEMIFLGKPSECTGSALPRRDRDSE